MKIFLDNEYENEKRKHHKIKRFKYHNKSNYYCIMHVNIKGLNLRISVIMISVGVLKEFREVK